MVLPIRGRTPYGRTMWGGRAPWLLLGTLMSAAAVTLGVGTSMFWSPCSDQLLNGSALSGYRFTGEFSASCLARMDAGLPFAPGWRIGSDPFVDYLVAAALLTLAVAWTGFVALQRWSLPARAVAALPGMLTGLLGVAVLPEARGVPIPAGWLAWLTVAIDLTALLAATVVVQHSHGAARLGQLVALWGVASFGWMRTLADYAFSLATSAATWDVPPGHGYATALSIAICAVAAAVLGLVRRRPRPGRLPAMARPQATW